MNRPYSLFFLVFWSLSSIAVAAEPRIALIMGVGDYEGTRFQTLPGISKDLKRMETALTATGFEVTVVENATLSTAERSIDVFGARLTAQKDAVGLFYFSGHGAEFEGKNYLIPNGARIAYVRDLKEQAVAAQRVLNRMEAAGARVNIVFLDCCRNDLTKAATDSGLAPMSAKGTFIGFATATDRTAAASSAGSPYTAFLAKHILTRGVSILDMHTQVTADVEDFTKTTGAEQTPFQYSGLRSSFFFVPNELAERSFGTDSARRSQPGMTNVAPLIPSLDTRPPIAATKAEPFINTVGMKFVPVPGTSVLFSVWETRVQDFAEFARATQREVQSQPFSQGPTHPVIASWEDAKAFCAWLSKTEKRNYRLPSDAEWSMAVGLTREIGGTPREKNGKIPGYPWGRQWPPPAGMGNFNSGGTAPVGSYSLEAYGLLDLFGNVWEWCEDNFDQTSGPYRVLRGGSWYNATEVSLVSSMRFWALPQQTFGNYGFRCVLVPGDN